MEVCYREENKKGQRLYCVVGAMLDELGGKFKTRSLTIEGCGQTATEPGKSPMGRG
jgi:hypothetical protein